MQLTYYVFSVDYGILQDADFMFQYLLIILA